MANPFIRTDKKQCESCNEITVIETTYMGSQVVEIYCQSCESLKQFAYDNERSFNGK